MPVLMEPGHLVLVDQLAHASMQTLMPVLAAGGARVKTLGHNRLEALETRLVRAGDRRLKPGDAGSAVSLRRRLALIEGQGRPHQ